MDIIDFTFSFQTCISIFIWVVWVFFLYKCLCEKELRIHFWLAISLKIIAGISLGGVYYWYLEQGKGADTFGFFIDGVFLTELAKGNFLNYLDFIFLSGWDVDQIIFQKLSIKNPRGVIFSKWVSFFVLIGGENYWSISIFFSLLSFTGIWLMVNTLVKFYPQFKLASLLAFCYWPSIVFWSSGVVKESLLMACLCTIVSIFLIILKAKKRAKWVELLIYALGTIVLSYVTLVLKYYYLAALLPTLLAIYASSKIKRYKQLSFFLVFGGSILLASFLHPNLSLDYVAKALVKNNMIMAEETADKSNLIHFNELDDSLISIIKNVPVAIIEGWSRPYIWEEGNIWKKLAAVETTILSLLIFLVLIPPYSIPKTPNERLLILGVITFCSLLLVMLTLAAPNLGNLIRYKSAFLPFALLLIFNSIKVKIEKYIHSY